MTRAAYVSCSQSSVVKAQAKVMQTSQVSITLEGSSKNEMARPQVHGLGGSLSPPTSTDWVSRIILPVAYRALYLQIHRGSAILITKDLEDLDVRAQIGFDFLTMNSVIEARDTAPRTCSGCWAPEERKNTPALHASGAAPCNAILYLPMAVRDHMRFYWF